MTQAQTKFSLVILDACRNNPFQGSNANKRGIGGTRGLAPISSNAAGIMVVYSAGIGQTAIDRLDDDDKSPNGLFTREFLKVMEKPGVQIQTLVQEAKQHVIEQAKSVGHDQVPAIYDQSNGTFFFLLPPDQKVTVTVEPEGASAQPDRESIFWQSVQGNPAACQEYLKQWPNGTYAGLAKLCTNKVDDAKRQVETARLAEIEQQRRVAENEKRLAETEERRKAVEARLADLEKQRQEAEAARLAEIEQQRRVAENEKRLAETEERRKSEEARLVDLERERQAVEAQVHIKTPTVTVNTSNTVGTGELIHGRYRDNGNGTVTDVKTNLQWKRCAEGQAWTGNTCSGNGKQYRWNSLPAVQNGWRVPTLTELKGIVYCSHSGVFGDTMETGVRCTGDYKKPTIDQEAFPNTEASFFWSGSPFAGFSNFAWYVLFFNGYDYWGNRSNGYAVRLVRAGQ